MHTASSSLKNCRRSGEKRLMSCSVLLNAVRESPTLSLLYINTQTIPHPISCTPQRPVLQIREPSFSVSSIDKSFHQRRCAESKKHKIFDPQIKRGKSTAKVDIDIFECEKPGNNLLTKCGIVKNLAPNASLRHDSDDGMTMVVLLRCRTGAVLN